MLGILCGFESEAKVARLLTPLVVCSGAREAVAYQQAENLVAQKATTILSFGLAGGLNPALKPNTLVIGDRVVMENGKTIRCDEKLTALLQRACPQAKKGGVYGSTHLVPSPAEKRPLYEKSGCLIVDMESHVAAEVATKHHIRFGILRGVSDTADETFPPAALVGINPNGSINVGATLVSVLKQPGQVPALINLFKNTDAVLKNLKRVAPGVHDLMTQF
jgi:hopanoid-associated phosphorylase